MALGICDTRGNRCKTDEKNCSRNGLLKHVRLHVWVMRPSVCSSITRCRPPEGYKWILKGDEMREQESINAIVKAFVITRTARRILLPAVVLTCASIMCIRIDAQGPTDWKPVETALGKAGAGVGLVGRLQKRWRHDGRDGRSGSNGKRNHTSSQQT